MNQRDMAKESNLQVKPFGRPLRTYMTLAMGNKMNKHVFFCKRMEVPKFWIFPNVGKCAFVKRERWPIRDNSQQNCWHVFFGDKPSGRRFLFGCFRQKKSDEETRSRFPDKTVNSGTGTNCLYLRSKAANLSHLSYADTICVLAGFQDAKHLRLKQTRHTKHQATT